MDSVFDGHHSVYMKALEKINIVENISKDISIENNKKKVIKYIKDRKYILKYALDKVEVDNILHLLYLDQLYTLGPIFKNNKYKKIIATLHHYPQNNIKEKLLKVCSKQIDTIIVHSDYLKEQLISLGIRNVEVIDYPIFNRYKLDNISNIKEKLSLDNDKYIISALGGTRYDKGLDILLESFEYVGEEIKSKIQINICGKEEDIKRDYIEEKCKELHINYRLKLNYMTDEEFYENIIVSDCIAIPYRNMFTGNSGPMTEGVYENKPIIAPNSGNLGYLMNKYELGVTFEGENHKDLARAIERLVEEGWNPNEKSYEYRERLNVESFINKHEVLYNKYL